MSFIPWMFDVGKKVRISKQAVFADEEIRGKSGIVIDRKSEKENRLQEYTVDFGELGVYENLLTIVFDKRSRNKIT
ncbi:TPA: hypothetical protein QC448_003619 [Bacillus cereus]|uniref:hypothetical protein n=1 Tax=Bacillus thuringiensis TaxID=1428 RepID=UPI000BFA2B87|nr:hypothetical protein [Bacillus thuringiensis]PFU71777.1 hypothetical protein COK95_07340 [Bacillus thuringiensis]HDR8129175.1 hypothetical protein [Bacillus cereus]HDR8492558.1 hypothetical protein [Bacillus cereus]